MIEMPQQRKKAITTFLFYFLLANVGQAWAQLGGGHKGHVLPIFTACGDI